MDYEQKYTKALWQMNELYNRVKYLSSPEALLTTVTLEKTFPELKESEDERIRKFLIDYINARCWYDKFPYTQEQVIAWLEKQGEQQDYNPYKATVESIASMCDRYSTSDDLKDFYNNIKVKCKDAVEYDNTWLEKQGEQKPAWSEEDEIMLEDAITAVDLHLTSNFKETHPNLYKTFSNVKDWLESIKDRVQPRPKQEMSSILN